MKTANFEHKHTKHSGKFHSYLFNKSEVSLAQDISNENKESGSSLDAHAKSRPWEHLYQVRRGARQRAPYRAPRSANINVADVVPKQYLPSDALVSVVRESLERDRLVRSSSSSDPQKSAVSEGNIKTELALNDALRASIANAVSALLSTISRGLARSNQETFVVAINGELTDPVLQGLVFRIPVGMKYLNSLSTFIYKDLVKFSGYGVFDNKFGKIRFENNELIIQSIKSGPDVRDSNWKKAEVFIPD